MISKIIAEELVQKAQDAIQSAEKVVIIAHVGPDGDAVGSSLGMWHYLISLGKEAKVILPNEYPDFLSWMPGSKQILIYEKEQEHCDCLLAEAQLICILDFNAASRASKMKEALLSSPAYKLMIDHHLKPENFADVLVSEPEMSSTCELLFRLICQMGDFSRINKACAACIYTGMMTDTGAFSYNSGNYEIFAIVAELLKTGIDKDEIYRNVFNTYSADRLRLMGYCLYEKMKIYPEYRTALISLSKEEMERFNYQNGDSEGFVNMPLSMKDIIFSVFMREENGKIKISLRSQGDFPCNRVAGDLFNGGGHLNASGGESKESLERTIEEFENALPSYAPWLQENK